MLPTAAGHVEDKELQEHSLNAVCVCMGTVGIIWGRIFTDGCVKGSRTGLRDSYYETKETLSLMVFKF